MKSMINQAEAKGLSLDEAIEGMDSTDRLIYFGRTTNPDDKGEKTLN